MHLSHPHTQADCRLLLPIGPFEHPADSLRPRLRKGVAKSVKSGIRIGFDFITQPAHLGFQDPRLEFLVRMSGLYEDVPSLRFHDQLFERGASFSRLDFGG